jgi:acetolactate synthase-1/2/3 large subunit
MDTTSGLCPPAPENLDVTTVTAGNGADDMVRIELQRLGAGSAPGPTAPDLLDLSRPTQGFVKLAEDIGVAPRRVHTADELALARRGTLIEPGPAPH